MAKLLDLDGVKILWNKIKTLIDSKITASESNITNNLQQYIATNLGANITQVVNKWMQDNKAEITKIVTQEINKQITQIDDKINNKVSNLKVELRNDLSSIISHELSRQIDPYVNLIESIRNDVLRHGNSITRLEQSINTINNNVDSIVNTAIDKKIKAITNESINPIIQ